MANEFLVKNGLVTKGDIDLNGNRLISSVGGVKIADITLPSGAGSAGQTLISDGAGNLSWGAGSAGALNDLSDVNTAGAVNGSVLKFNGSSWVAGSDLTGTGTVTSVGLSSTTAAITVSGSPVTTSGTLSVTFDPTAVVITDLSGNLPVGRVTGLGSLATLSPTGTASASTFLRGDGQWAAVTAGSVDWNDVTGKPTTLSGYGITDGQPLDADLTAIAGLSGSGILRRSGANTWVLDSSSYLTGNQSISITGDATGTGSTAITLTLADTGVVAGTYPKVTVDAKGRVTGGASLTNGDVPALAAPSTGYLRWTGSAFVWDTPTVSLPNVGTAGTYAKVTTDAQGRVTSGVSQISVTDISASGTASASTFLRGDGQWATPAGGGGSSTFTDLTDVPDTYVANALPVVNGAGDGMAFATLANLGIIHHYQVIVTMGANNPNPDTSTWTLPPGWTATVVNTDDIVFTHNLGVRPLFMYAAGLNAAGTQRTVKPMTATGLGMNYNPADLNSFTVLNITISNVGGATTQPAYLDLFMING